MSTPHNSANKGDVAKVVLLPGDPLRAKYIAENYLTDVRQFNHIRNNLGYTGMYNGKQISVMSTGMGCPSMGIYSYELIHIYGVETLIRIGSCGALSDKLGLGDLVMAMGVSTDSNYAAAAGAHALSILTVSDLLFSGKSMSADERERGFKDMMEVSLNTAWTRA